MRRVLATTMEVLRESFGLTCSEERLMSAIDEMGGIVADDADEYLLSYIEFRYGLGELLTTEHPSFLTKEDGELIQSRAVMDGFRRTEEQPEWDNPQAPEGEEG